MQIPSLLCSQSFLVAVQLVNSMCFLVIRDNRPTASHSKGSPSVPEKHVWSRNLTKYTFPIFISFLSGAQIWAPIHQLPHTHGSSISFVGCHSLRVLGKGHLSIHS